MEKLSKNLKWTTAQSVLEYTIVLGLVAIIFVAIAPLFKRGVQSVVRLTADQIQGQANADQNPNSPGGYLVGQYSASQALSNTSTEELFGVTRYTRGDSEVSTTNSTVNLGFTNRGN